MLQRRERKGFSHLNTKFIFLILSLIENVNTFPFEISHSCCTCSLLLLYLSVHVDIQFILTEECKTVIRTDYGRIEFVECELGISIESIK